MLVPAKQKLLPIFMALGLAACAPSAPPPSPANKAPNKVTLPEIKKQEVQPIVLSDLESKTANITTGLAQGPTLYVFCNTSRNCLEFWDSLKELQASARIVWIPVAGSRPNALEDTTALLNAPSPAAVLDSFAKKSQKEKPATPATTGLPPDSKSVADSTVAKIKGNEALQKAYGVEGLPFTIGEHVTSKKLTTLQGGVSIAEVRATYGLPAEQKGIDAPVTK